LSRLLIAGAAVFSVFVAIGTVASQFKQPSFKIDPDSKQIAQVPSVPDDASRASLESYTRKLETSSDAHATQTPPAGQALPDVDTLIQRLAARLQTAPNDVKGWRLLGWSYFHTERFNEAAAAYAKALELEPHSVELRSSYDKAKSRASAGVARRE
jgi:cytochrome c-type biogenesis protein CcmH